MGSQMHLEGECPVNLKTEIEKMAGKAPEAGGGPRRGFLLTVLRRWGAPPASTLGSDCSLWDSETRNFYCGSHSVGGTLQYLVTTALARSLELVLGNRDGRSRKSDLQMTELGRG